MTLPNHANMDALPLELKQRICSFLAPEDLKPLRLTCKVFATAAERYLIERFILFLHPKSLAALRNIAEHMEFSKYLTTVIYDSTGLGYRSWQTSRRHPLIKPQWDDYRPKTLTLNEHESYAELTTRIMRNATNNYEAARAEVRAHRLRLIQLYYYQQSPSTHVALKKEMKYALMKCRRLRNIVLSSSHSTTVGRARAQTFEVAHSRRWWTPHICSPRINFWDTPTLESLTFIDADLNIEFYLDDAQAMRNLKHLRISLDDNHPDFGLDDLRFIFDGLCQLQTLSLFATNCDITKTIKAIRSNNLQVCLMDFDYVQGDALVAFLLHHARTLQRLALGVGATDTGWAPVFSRIAGLFLLLKRVQLEALRSRENQFYMRRDAELQAERFVLSGGLMPLIRYTSLDSEADEYLSPGRGFTISSNPYGQLPPGLWPDYESSVNEYWDGRKGDSEDENKEVNKNVEEAKGEEQVEEEPESEEDEEYEEDQGDHEDD
ncbi:hypothetical protein KCV07_g3809, partial [Aureobasidium melanogenum]